MCDKGCREEEVADVTTYNVHTDTDEAKHDQVCNDDDASQMSIGWSFRCYLVCWWCVAWAGLGSPRGFNMVLHTLHGQLLNYVVSGSLVLGQFIG